MVCYEFEAQGTSQSSILGEATINLADYSDASQPASISLPLIGSDHGTILHFEQQRDKGMQSGNNIDKETKPNTTISSSFEQEMLDAREMNKRHVNEIGNETQKFSQELASEIASVYERNIEKSDHVKKVKWVNGVLLVEDQIRNLKEKVYTGSHEPDLSFFEVLFNTVQDLKKEIVEPESMLPSGELPSPPLKKLLVAMGLLRISETYSIILLVLLPCKFGLKLEQTIIHICSWQVLRLLFFQFMGDVQAVDGMFQHLLTLLLLNEDSVKEVKQCIAANKMADALVIAQVGSDSLWESTLDQYLKNNSSSYLEFYNFVSAGQQVVSTMVNKDLLILVNTRPQKPWKETLDLLCNFVQGEGDWTLLCDTLASRIIAATNTLVATICYICAGNNDKIMEMWSKNVTSECEGKSYVDLLQDLMEKTIVLALATGLKRFSASLCKLVDNSYHPIVLQGSAEVLFSRRSDAFQALKRYNNVQLDGRPMMIEIEGSKSEIPIFALVNVVGDDAERYKRAYEAYEQFQGMTNQEAEGSGTGIKRTRIYIPRDREEAEQLLLKDYFGNDDTPPKYPEENFRRRYRMSSTIFAKIVNDITSYDAQPLPEYFRFFRQRIDAIGRNSISPILKITSAIRQLAYGTAPDAFDEYLQIAERCSCECLDNFTKCIYILYVEEYLRKPSLEDIEKTYALHEEKHGLPGMLGSIDWSNNDLNVLYGSPLFDYVLADTAPEAPFVVNGRTYKKGHYLADGIYPTWSTFVKTFSIARDEKTLKFKRVQESGIPSEERVLAAAVCMEGEALSWYRWSKGQTLFYSWDGFKRRLLLRFQQTQGGNLYEQFLSIIQEGTAREYVAMFEKLACQLAGVSQSVLEATFIKGLKPDLRAAVRVMKPESLAHAMDLAISIEDNQQFEGVTRTGVETYRSNISGFYSSNRKCVNNGFQSIQKIDRIGDGRKKI
ncbi:RNA-directed DNA polymerase, eukaryota [Tanacetum coccineum]